MNPITDLEVRVSFARERQADMRREAQIDHMLRSRNPNREGDATLRQKLALTLVGALLAALLIAQLLAAAASAGGGWPLMMNDWL